MTLILSPHVELSCQIIPPDQIGTGSNLLCVRACVVGGDWFFVGDRDRPRSVCLAACVNTICITKPRPLAVSSTMHRRRRWRSTAHRRYGADGSAVFLTLGSDVGAELIE